MGGETVDFDVVDEDNLLVGWRQSGHDGPENSGLGLSKVHFVGQEETVEMIVQMVGRIDKIEMKVVAVRKQVYLVARGAEPVHESEAFCRQVGQHCHPSVDDLLTRGTGVAEPENLRNEMIRRDEASLKVRHELFGSYADRFDTFTLGIHAQDKAHVLLAHQCLEGLHTARDMEVDEHPAQIEDDDGFVHYLPNGLNECDQHKAAGDQFENGSEKDAYKTTPSCFEGFVELFASDELAEYSPNERAQDNADCAKEKSDENADGTPPHSPFGTAIMLCAPSWNDIVENRDDDGDNSPNKEKLPTEVNAVGRLCDPKAGIGNRRTRQTRYDTAGNTYQHT